MNKELLLALEMIEKEKNISKAVLLEAIENSLLTAREACRELAGRTRSEEVQVIGAKFVLYRQHYDKSRRKIELVKDRTRRPAGQ